MEKEIKEKLKDRLEEKYFLREECRVDSLIKIESKDARLYSCKGCVFKDSACYNYAKLKDIKKVVR